MTLTDFVSILLDAQEEMDDTPTAIAFLALSLDPSQVPQEEVSQEWQEDGQAVLDTLTEDQLAHLRQYLVHFRQAQLELDSLVSSLSGD